MKPTAFLRAWVCLLFVMLGASVSFAQTTGTIRGTIKDPSGGVVPAATVSVTQIGMQTVRTAPADKDGDYEFPELAVGHYALQVDASGFKKFVVKDVNVTLGHVTVINPILQLGESKETVTVEANALQVETTNTQLGGVMNEVAVSQLPLNARDTYQLLQLQPGVQSQLGLDLFYGSDKAGVVSVNGGRGRSNNYMVNGGDANDVFVNLPAIQPSPDAIEEFRVLTNTFDAEFGRNSGSVVNVVTKSGTNEFHGNLFEFFRNKVLNARGFFDTVKPDSKQNQFGGTFGGPIKKEKTFFFTSFEAHRIIRGIPSDPVIVPTSAELAGDFSAGSLFSGTLADNTVAQILNNRSGCAAAIAGAGGTAPAAGVVYSAIFPGNKIPTQCFDPVAVNLLRFVPPPNRGNDIFQTPPISRNNSNQFTGKMDHQINANQRLTGYYYIEDDHSIDPFARFQAAGSNIGSFGGLTNQRIQQVSLSHAWTIGSTAVNEARFAYFREAQGQFNHPLVTGLVTKSCTGAAAAFCFTGTSDTPLVDANNVPIPPSAKLGITPNLGAMREGVPFITVSGGFVIGNNFEGEIPQVGNTFQLADTYSKIIGRHSLKFGADLRRTHFDQTLFFNINGDFTFASNPSSPSSNDVGFRNAYPNYLLGLPTSFSQGSAQTELIRSTSVYLFAEDSWKIKSTVTLNYGLRWELNTPLGDIGQKIQTFRPGQATKIYPCQLSAASQTSLGYPDTNCNPGGSAAAVFPLGLVVPGDKGISNGLTQTYYKSFAPRIGLAWTPGWSSGWLSKLTGGPGKSSIRMGWGIFYNPIEQLVLEQFSAEPPFGGSSFFSNTLFSTPYVAQSGLINPNPFNGVLNPTRGKPVDWSVFRPILLFGQFPPDMRSQYSEQYNLTLQRELSKNLLLQIGYVGSQGHRLLASYDLNPGNPRTCLDLINIATANPNNLVGFNGSTTPVTCGSLLEDSSYFILPGTVIPAGGLHLPYTQNGQPNFIPAGTTVGSAGITLVGLRKFSSPLCDPMTGINCPADGVPVFSNIFTENTIANSNYNSLQVLLERHFSKGLQLQGAYTFSKSIDNASSFESALNPVNFRSTRGLSLFDARHRFVLSYYWEIPVPKLHGFASKILNGWATSGIYTLQAGFPVRITTGTTDNELFSSFFFEAPGEPNLIGKFRSVDPHKQTCALGTGPTAGPNASTPPLPCQPINAAFDPNQFTNATVPLGTIGNSPRSICCGPGINNFDIGFHKNTPLSERTHLEFRAEIFNIVNHTQFTGVNGDISTGPSFGRVLRVRDPREIQFAVKLFF